MVFAEYRRILPYLAPYWRRLLFVLSISLFSTVLGLGQPYVSKLLIDEALLRRNPRALWVAAVLMVALTVFSFIFSILSGYRYVQISAAVLFDMRLALYRHLQALSPRYYARARLGDIVSRLNNDIAEVQRVSSDTILASVANVVFLAGSVAIMCWLNWKLFLLSVALLPLSAVALRHYQRRLAGHVRSLRERSAEIGSFLIETLQGMRLVVTEGTAEDYAQLENISSAGKTGTGEFCDKVANDKGLCIPGQWPTHAWYAAFAPYENPEIAVIAFVYNGAEGAITAGPIVKQVLEAYFNLKAIDAARQS